MRLSQTTAALEAALAAIRKLHPDTQPAIIVVYKNPSAEVRGHYSPAAWTVRANSGRADEIHISSTILSQGAASVFRTLLHEAVHSIADARGIQDTSRQGRYHNTRFARLARELGLTTEKASGIGFTTPALTPAAEAVHSDTIAALDAGILAYQSHPLSANDTATQSTRMLKLACATCGRIIRASQETIDGGPIICQPCDAEFQPAP